MNWNCDTLPVKWCGLKKVPIFWRKSHLHGESTDDGSGGMACHRAPFQTASEFLFSQNGTTYNSNLYRNSHSDKMNLWKWTPKKTGSYYLFFWVFFRSLQAWHAGAGCWAGNLSLDEVSKTQFLLRGHRFFPESSKRAEVLQTAEKMVLSKNGILWAGRGGLRCWDCQLGVFWFLFLCLRRRLSCFKKVNVWPW